MKSRNKLELYIHIPFCVQKCLYCDFLSAPGDERTKKDYMDALFAEMKGKAPLYRDILVVSVFIGGGTPSVLEEGYIQELMAIIKKEYAIQADAEVTIEVNPGTVNLQKLVRYRRAGVNRLSIGLQSAADTELKRLGRIHDFAQFMQTYEDAVKAGFDNINVDLMSNIPGQSPESWLHTLDTVVKLKPAPRHISAYSLIVEEGTPFFEMQEHGDLEIADEDSDRRMYADTKRVLENAGYRRYEISNYARPGYECRHNCGYWRRRDYIGFGLGASSLFYDTRFSNCRDMKKYLENPCESRVDEEILTKRGSMEEFLFLGLRMTDGVAFEDFQDQFGEKLNDLYGEIIQKNERDGLLYEYERGGRHFLALTDRGIDVSNAVFVQFLE